MIKSKRNDPTIKYHQESQSNIINQISVVMIEPLKA